ncbi:TPA: hypothetical protein U0919_001811 [Streptococcus suis]|nr:hypothetical protein [Streptococcus suis]
MGMNLKNFFDLDKVKFTDWELEAPYETYDLSKLKYRNFSYTSAELPVYTTLPTKKVVVRPSQHSQRGWVA